MIGIYARVSTEEQAKKGTSLTEQIRDCRKKAGTESIKEYIDDGYSGEFLDRPGLDQLRDDVRNGIITQVITLDPDRWSRSLMNQLLVTDEIEKKAELLFVNGEYAKTPEGRLFYQMRGAISEFEKAKINERMSRGRIGRAREGKILRDYHVYGYGYEKSTRSMYVLEDEERIVKFIFDSFTSPSQSIRGINGIALYLTEQGIPTKKGAAVWHKQVVRQMLMNPVYTGKFYQHKWNTEGMLGNKYKKNKEDKVPMKLRPEEDWIYIPVPSIISEEQFEHAQLLLGESKRRFAREAKNKYLLSGIIRCGKCGNTMTGRKSKNWGKYVFEYTDIKNTAGYAQRGCGNRVKCEDIDVFVWDQVSAWLNQPDEIAAAKQPENDQSFESAELDRIERDMEKNRSGRKKLLALFAGGGKDIGEDEIRDMLRDMKEEEEKLLQRKSVLEGQLGEKKKFDVSRNVVKEAVEYYLQKNQGELTVDDKQELIRHIVKEIRVYDDEVEIYTF
ncbi:recombinase family protein [Paenibacillus filicis]|uniref:Recombinase family protein n=1 Tax=Paenibacillus filicis TaxID=669464 RepID=A0ABU9DJU7_9BACL